MTTEIPSRENAEAVVAQLEAVVAYADAEAGMNRKVRKTITQHMHMLRDNIIDLGYAMPPKIDAGDPVDFCREAKKSVQKMPDSESKTQCLNGLDDLLRAFSSEGWRHYLASRQK